MIALALAGDGSKRSVTNDGCLLYVAAFGAVYRAAAIIYERGKVEIMHIVDDVEDRNIAVGERTLEVRHWFTTVVCRRFSSVVVCTGRSLCTASIRRRYCETTTEIGH